MASAAGSVGGGGGGERSWWQTDSGAVTEVFRTPMKKLGNKARRRKSMNPIWSRFELLLLFVGGMDDVCGGS